MPTKMTPKSQAKIKPQFTHTLFHTKNIFFASSNAIFDINTHTHFLHFVIKKPSKNRYTRKQPTHFSMKP